MARLVIVCKFCKRSLEGENGESDQDLLVRFLGPHNYHPYVQGNKEQSSRYCIVLLTDKEGIERCLQIAEK